MVTFHLCCKEHLWFNLPCFKTFVIEILTKYDIPTNNYSFKRGVVLSINLNIIIVPHY